MVDSFGLQQFCVAGMLADTALYTSFRVRYLAVIQVVKNEVKSRY